MLYLCGCTKGGVGKTTLATSIAGCAADCDRRVCLVDADKSGHANLWAAARARDYPLVAKVTPRVLSGHIGRDLQRLVESGEFDDVVVDAGGHDSRELRAAMRVADCIIMPFAVGQFDLNEVETMVDLIAVAREYNPRLFALAVINRADRVRPKASGEARAFVQQFEDALMVAEVMVHYRPAVFDKTSKSGLWARELDTESGWDAADEIARVMDEAGADIDDLQDETEADGDGMGAGRADDGRDEQGAGREYARQALASRE